jgi:hypothetical protein
VIDARQKYVFFFCCSHPTASKTRHNRKPGNFYRINFCKYKTITTTTTTIVSETTKKPSSSPGAPSVATKLATFSIFFSFHEREREREREREIFEAGSKDTHTLRILIIIIAANRQKDSTLA